MADPTIGCGSGVDPPNRLSNNLGRNTLNIVNATNDFRWRQTGSGHQRNVPSAIENHIAQIVKVFQIHSGDRTNAILSR